MKLTQSARRRKIGVARVLEAMTAAGEPTVIPATDDYDERLRYVGHDHTGLELEVLAANSPTGSWSSTSCRPTGGRTHDR